MKKNKNKFEEWIKPENLLRIAGWAKDGLTDEEIAKNMGIVRSTLWEWRKKEPNISNSLRINKDIADRQVENVLFKTALEGNTTAIIFWLKNRKPKEWRDQSNIEQSIEYNIKNVQDVEIEWIK